MKKILLTIPSNLMRSICKPFIFLLFTIGMVYESNAQQLVAQSYSVTQATGLTYTPITGGTVYVTASVPAGTTFVNTAPALAPIGFTFNFNGINYTNATITDNGFITFGGTPPAANNFLAISGNTAYEGCVSAFGLTDFRSASTSAANYPTTVSTIRYETIGASPNRIFVVQYENVVRYTTGGAFRAGLMNFQIRLNESTNVVETVYNTFDAVGPPAAGIQTGQVGLRGATNADFNNRTNTTTDWSATIAGTTNAAAMSLRPTAPICLITSVTRFTWTPCFTPTSPTAVLQADNSTATFSWTSPLFLPSGGFDWEVRTSGAPGSGAAGLFLSGNTALSSVSVPGLVLGSTYHFYVKSNCRTTWLPVNTFPSTVTLSPVCSNATIPYTQNFESVTTPAIPTCNSIVTPAGQPFATVNNSVVASYGFNNKNLITTGDLAKNAWYFTQPINFSVAGEYRLSYKYGGTREQVFFQQKMRVFYGAAASVVGMTIQLDDHPDIKNSPLNNVVNFTVPTAGIYYIGFYAYANATNGSLQLDDIVVDLASCRTPTALSSGQVTYNSAVVTWTPPALAPSAGYSYFISTSPTAPSNSTIPTGTVGAGVNVITASGLNASTTYYVWVRSNCGSELSTWSSVTSFTTLVAPPPPPTYCIPVQSGGSQVSSVRFNTINNNVTQVSPFYDDYPATGLTTTSVRVTQTYPLQVTTAGSSIVSVWIDYDRSGTFDTSEWSQVWTNATSGSINITIPLTASGGLTKMRVRSRLNGNPNGSTDACSTFGSGSTHDYTIFINNTPPPALTLSGTSTSICNGDTSANVSITSALTNFDVYSWSPSTGVSLVSPGVYNFNPTTTTNYTLTGQLTSGTFDTNTAVYSVTVKPRPTAVIITPAAPTICQNAIPGQSLSATGGIVSGSIVTGVSEDFNSGLGGYTTVNNSSNTGGGNPALSAWTLRNSPFTTTTATETLVSNDNSQFITSDSDWQGFDGLTRTELISPVFDLTTFSDASLSFWHYYRSWTNGGGRVQISTNGGGSYVDLVSYTTVTVGGATSFANQIISLNAYAGLNNLRLRFIYSTDYGYRWSIDNIVVSGTNTSNIVWSPTANLFTDFAGTIPYTGTPRSNVFVKTSGSASLSFTATSTGAGCSSFAVVPVTVTPVSGGAPSPLNQVLSCVASASDIVLSGFNGTITKWQYSLSPTFASGIIDIPSSNSSTLTSAQIGTFTTTRYYRAVVTNGSCSHFSTIASVSLNRTIYNGTAWNNGLPDNTKVAEFQGNFSSTANLNACSVVVTSGNVVFNVGHTLTAQTTVTVTGGTLTFENQSSLNQVLDVTNAPGVYSGGNSGSITYKRVTTPLFKFDYTYWSTPVNPQNLLAVSPLSPSSLFFEFNPISNNWQYVLSPSTTNMTPAKGYIFRAPNNFPAGFPSAPQTYAASFNGVPNNGTITLPVVGGASQMNLLGNPYPSAVSADAFLLDPANAATLSGSLYFWTHNTPITNNNYSGSDYAIYNYLGGTVGGVPTGAATNPGLNVSVPTGKIASGQGFFIKGLSNGLATFKNSMRIVGDNNQFFRMSSNNVSTTSTDKNRYWLDISNAQGAFKQVLVGYVEEATLGLDRLYDADMIDIGSEITLYTIADNTKLTIQGRPSFTVNDIVPLGYKSTVVGSYTIRLAMFEGVFNSQTVYLEDTLLGVIHDLKVSDYTFATQIGTFENRFVLRYTTQSLGNDNPTLTENTIIVYKNNQGLHINSGIALMNTVTVYDIRGRQIAIKNNIGATETILTNIPSTNQVLLIKIEGLDGEVVTKKIVF